MADCCCVMYKPDPLSWVPNHIQVDKTDKFDEIFNEKNKNIEMISDLSQLRINYKYTVIQYAAIQGAADVFQLFLEKDAIKELNHDLEELKIFINSKKVKNMVIQSAFNEYYDNFKQHQASKTQPEKTKEMRQVIKKPGLGCAVM